MRHRRIALTGPCAAERTDLDGFRDRIWPLLWVAPHSGAPGDRIIRTRSWEDPVMIGGELLAPMPTLLRHLGAVPADLSVPESVITPRDRVELALEHAMRLGLPLPRPCGGRLPGDALLNEVLALRGAEPATESYAETRAVQFLRTMGITPWRQIPISARGRRFRADLMMPFRPMPRPEQFRPEHGVLLEVDSREHHEDAFDHDQERDATYTALGFHWVGITPTQMEHRPEFARRVIIGALRRAGHPR